MYLNYLKAFRLSENNKVLTMEENLELRNGEHVSVREALEAVDTGQEIKINSKVTNKKIATDTERFISVRVLKAFLGRLLG